MSARFPHSRNPLCELPRDDSLEARVAAAHETLQSVSNLVDGLLHALESEGEPTSIPNWTILSVGQHALAHTMQLLESQDSTA